MVAGGYADVLTQYTNSVELITPNVEFADKCRKNVESLFGNKFKAEIQDYDYETREFFIIEKEVDEFAAAEMTGLFVKDAPIGNYDFDLAPILYCSILNVAMH